MEKRVTLLKKIFLVLLISSLVVISGCTNFTKSLLGNSIKDISQNKDKYLGKELTITGEYSVYVSFDFVNGIGLLKDEEGYYVYVNNCQRSFENGRVYTVSGVLTKFVGRQLPYAELPVYYILDCSALKIGK